MKWYNSVKVIDAALIINPILPGGGALWPPYSNTSNSALFGIQNLGHYSKKALIEVTVI